MSLHRKDDHSGIIAEIPAEIAGNGIHEDAANIFGTAAGTHVQGLYYAFFPELGTISVFGFRDAVGKQHKLVAALSEPTASDKSALQSTEGFAVSTETYTIVGRDGRPTEA